MVRVALIFILTFSILVETVFSLSIEQPCQDFIENYVESEKPKICNTPGCVKAAYTLLQNMDSTAEPCEDFYQYACGGFEEKVRIPDSESSKTQFGLISDELQKQLRDILQSDDTKEDNKVFQQAKDHYKACMDLEKLEEIGHSPLLENLKLFGGWPVLDGDKWDESKFDWLSLLYKFRENGYSSDLLFDFSIGTDLMNSTWRTISFDQPGLSLSREFMIQGLKNENVRHYFNLMKRTAIAFGANPETVEKELEETLNFEIKLSNASLPKELRRNAFKLYNPMTLADLGHLIPWLDWTEYTNRILTKEIAQVDSTERVIVYGPEYLTNLTKILAEEPKRNIANYMLWKVALSTLGYMDKSSRDLVEQYSRDASGKTDDTPRWKTCVSTAAGSFSAAVGQLYVTKHFNEEAKEKMMEMVHDIKDEFKMILDEVKWMDEGTKVKAHSKLQSIKDYIGYPQEILNNTLIEDLYDGIEVTNNTFYQNSINMGKWSIKYSWSKLRDQIDKTDWKRHANPAVVNAYYSGIENSIQFPAGILQGIFFDKDRPTYMNYAGIGWVIGHEITHGFDDKGRQYNEKGNLQNWWDDETKAKFLNKTKCIIDQYSKYEVKELDVSLNGVTTQGENIADNGGAKEAYKAYQKWVSRHGEEQRLPGLDLNQKQLFWLSGANIWCSTYRPKSLKTTVQVGSHAPGMFRVQGTYSNNKEFAKDFNCPIGSTYNPEDKCEVW